ncbi:MAG: tRNA 2-thiouridine(34) synthase MnmA [Patescibacteria group bacterium]|jgi:tRNA-specific 2-thiouridylase
MDTKLNKGKKIAIAMSGGVDSSVAAALLKQQGYDCIGIFLKFWTETKTDIENKCCSADAYNDARRVANKIGFPLYTLNFQQPFKKTVVDDWLRKHRQGLTPNPCIRCNQFIKFDLLLRKAKMLGCDYLATGHYAEIRKQKSENRNLSLISGLCFLKTAKDKQKDQSYFLYTLTQNQLKHLLFPLGNLTKTEVRAIAKKLKLPVYQKAESQEICFIPEKTHYPFLKRHLKLKPGPIKNLAGKALGQHDGLPLYTLGQRQGIKIGGIGPFYVVKLDYKTNTLFVSNNRDDKLLYTKKFKIKELNWILGQPPKKSEKFGVKIRYQAKTIPCTINKNIVTLKIPQRAIMPGQSAVFYQGQTVLGGGVINSI